jgi:hypothetical protein
MKETELETPDDHIMESSLNLFNNEKFKDFTIFYDEKSVTAHKCILSACSNYFDRMLCGEWNEKNSCTIQPLYNISVGDFQTFIKYLYLQSQSLLSHRGWIIFELCDYFDVLPSIREKVMNDLIDHISIENAGRFIPLVNRSTTMTSDFNHNTNNNDNNSSTHNSLYAKFLEFLIGNSAELAERDFPFHELDPMILKDIFLNNGKGSLREGTKVEGNYRGRGKWFPGRIKRDRGNDCYDIDYEDGESESNVEKSLIRKMKEEKQKDKKNNRRNGGSSEPPFSVGTRVEANFKGRGRYYPGKIKEEALGGGKYDIQYDDGETELNVDESDIRLIQ